MIYNELKQHGTEDFPFELYRVNALHPKYEMAFHWHTALEIIRVLDGKLTLTLDNRVHVLHAGEVAFINSETVHGATPADCLYECIVFNLAFLKTGNADCDGFIDHLLSHTAFLSEHPIDNTVVALTNSIFEKISNQTNGAPFKVIGTFLELLGELREKGLYTSHLPVSYRHDEKKVLKLKAVLK